MFLIELLVLAVLVLLTDLFLLIVFDASAKTVWAVSLIITVLFLLRFIIKGVNKKTLQEQINSKYGSLQASLCGIELLAEQSGSGVRCDMLIYPHQVILVVDTVDESKRKIHAIDLDSIQQVKLGTDGSFRLSIIEEGRPKQLTFKSTSPMKQIIAPLETLQAEIVFEHRIKVMREVGQKAKKLSDELQKELEIRRRKRVEGLQKEGMPLIKRFSSLVPVDFFVKETKFEKLLEVLKLEFLGRKSPLPGPVERFLDDDFKLFAQLLREKAGFDFEDEEDLVILLKVIREQVRRNAVDSFMQQYSIAFERAECAKETEYVDTYIRVTGSNAQDPESLEGFRLFLEKQNYRYSFKQLTQIVSDYCSKLEKDSQIHSFERKINVGTPAFSEVAELDVLSNVEYAEFLKSILVEPGDEVEDIVVRDQEPIALVFTAGQRVLVHAFKGIKSVTVEDVEQAMQAKGAFAAEVVMLVTTSLVSNKVVEAARRKGIVLWDRVRLQYEMQLACEKRKHEISVGGHGSPTI